jgi:hypothetical protein
MAADITNNPMPRNTMVVSADTVLKIANTMDAILSTTATATHICLVLLIISPSFQIIY